MTKILVATLLVFVAGMFAIPGAFAYESLEKYLPGNVQTPAQVVKDHPGAGSGTPFLAPDGVLGASAIAASIFGGIAAMFFIRGRHGRYVAQGRG